MKYLALALLLAAATPAVAGEDFPFPTLTNQLDADGLVDAPEVDPSPDFNGSVDIVGGTNIVLDLTPLNVITALFDVGPQVYQHLGYTTAWACFTAAGRRVWYIADNTYETRDDTYIGSIIDEPDDPATSALFLCKEEPKAMLKENPALPAIGTTLAELNAFYKTSIPADARFVTGYADNDENSVVIYYRLTDGVVDAMQIGGSANSDEETPEAQLNGMAEEVLASEWAEPTHVDDYLFNPLQFEAPGTSFLLDATSLADVQAAFGGTPGNGEIFEGTPVDWLCYDTGTSRTTFAAVRSQSEGNETIAPGPVLGVVIEEANASTNFSCSANDDAAKPNPGNGIPGLGATVADLAARFGSAPVDAGGHLAYVTEYDMGDEESWVEQKIIYYRIEDDVVTGVAYRLNTIR